LVMDPHHRVVLELAAELFADAGYRAEEVAGSRTGVFLGGGESPYLKGRLGELSQEQLRRAVVNTIPNMMAARVSDFFDLRGPALVVDAACSSAAVAVHQAVRALRSGDCDAAIVGGIELMTGPDLHIGFGEAGVLSPDGVCAVFDERANGLVPGEGAGLLLLKPLHAAVAEGDRVLAVIEGGAVNNDGRTMGLTVPSGQGQQDVVAAALADAGVRPGQIGYLEAHGTGTLLGDPIEVRAATAVFSGPDGSRPDMCGIGSVKSNIGHLMRAAAVPAVMKAVLAVREGVLPATVHCERPHPRFRFGESPFFPVTRTTPWPSGQVRRAGVSAFGFGGTNVHLVVAEYRGDAVGRASLPPPRFHRKHYRIGSPVGTETLDQLLDLVTSGQVELDDAVTRIGRMGEERV
jgi:acyl transferase domain-containing protein